MQAIGIAIYLDLENLPKGIDFDFKGTRFKRLSGLTADFEKAGVVRLGRNAKGVTQIEDVDDSQLGIEDHVPSKSGSRASVTLMAADETNGCDFDDTQSTSAAG
jgi:hypothetical protein